MSKIFKRPKDLKSMGNHGDFLQRIQKTLYYGKLPSTDRLSLPATEMASELFSEPRSGRSLDRLHCKDAAYISRQACISPCSFVLAVLYLERLKKCNPDYLQTVAPSELFLVSLMVSSKFLHDCGEEDEVFMDEWAKSGGVSVKELICLERQFLNAIEWEIFVNNEAFWTKLSAIEATLAKKQGFSRGYFTYTELNNLLQFVEIDALIQFVASILTILMATYTACLLTIVGSVFIVSHVPGNCLQAPQTSQATVQNATTQTEIALAKEYFDNLDNLCGGNNKKLDAADVLKTSIFLASITTSHYDKNYSVFDKTENSENISWDWWTSPAMNWLSTTSGLIEKLNIIPLFTKFTHNHFIDKTIAITKMIDLEDQLHKGTKVRMQDQLEQSWHEEWTDSIADFFRYGHISFPEEIKVRY